MSTGQGTSAPRSTPGSDDGSGGWTPRLVLSLFCMAMVMEIVSLSYMKVATALPAIAGHFRTTQAAWLITATVLFGAVASPLFGRLADLYGKRRMLLIALILAWVGSVAAATAPNYGVLIAGRALQGALITGMFLSYSLIRDVFPPRTVPLAVSICTSGLGLAAVVTPFLNGWLLDTWGWRSVFVFDLAWITVMAVGIPLTTKESPLRRRARLDIPGALLLGGGAALVLVAVSFAGEWGTPRTLLLVLVGVALLAGWWVSAKKLREPLIELSVLSRPPIVAAALVSGIVYGVAGLSATILPIMSMLPRMPGVDYGLGLSATGFAQVASPNAAAVMVGGLLVGLTVRRIGIRTLLIAGLLGVIAGALYIAAWHETLAHVVIGAAILGLGSGICYAVTPNLVIESTPAGEQGAVSSVVQLFQSGISSVMPVALFAILAYNVALVVPKTGTVVYSMEGLRYGWFLAAGLAAVGVVVTALALRRSDRAVAPVGPARATADEAVMRRS